jgi:hypothetical protein
MNKKLAIIVGGLVALAAIVGWWHWSQGVAAESAIAMPKKPETVTSSAAEAGRGSALDAPTFGEFTSRLTRVSAIPPGDAAWFRIQAAQFCEALPFARARALKAGRPPPSGEAFCKDFVGTGEGALDVLQSLPREDAVVTAYESASVLFASAPGGSKANAGDFAAATKTLSSMMQDPGAGAESVVAAEALQGVGFVSADTAALAKEKAWPLGRAELATAQTLASQMQMCARYGGCGSNQPYALFVCSQVGTCRDGDSAETAWKKRYSPLTYQAAIALRQQRLANQSN